MRLVFWKHQSGDSIENGRRRGRKWRFTDSEGLLQ